MANMLFSHRIKKTQKPSISSFVTIICVYTPGRKEGPGMVEGAETHWVPAMGQSTVAREAESTPSLHHPSH